MLGLNPGPLQEQPVLLTSELSLQPQSIHYLINELRRNMCFTSFLEVVWVSLQLRKAPLKPYVIKARAQTLGIWGWGWNF